ncbi:MAG: T9SS type A sorting domain-containing protein [Chitinophagaceae bacterium]|nr:T9SS type A sorting domain-containing protein [Chitinophagaceae bacterium]
MKRILTCCFAFLLLSNANQVLANALYPVSLEEKITYSTNIVEGKVVSQTCFWNANHTFIFTSNKIKVYKIFKGGITADYIEVLTQGGTIGDLTIEASDLLSLQIGNIGVFFLYPNVLNLKSPITGEVLMDVYSSSQGCFVYNYNNSKALAPFVTYNDITGRLYSELSIKTGNAMIIKDPSFTINSNSTEATPVISSFSPMTVNAGASLDPTTNVLAINGSSFGTPGGSAAVLFSDGNTGGISPSFVVNSTDNQIISWTETQIKLRVPTRAATGYFAVRESSGLSTQSTDFLNVFYSILSNTLSGVTKEANLMNQNGTGGYTVYFSNSTNGGALDFDASDAKFTAQRALQTWRETVGMNWPEGGTTASQNIANNLENIIMYDNTNTGVSPLSSGVLAVCYSYFNGCSGQELQKTAFDIIVRNAGVSQGSANFTTGPCYPSSSQIDLETVMLHELGHALNLGHINDGTQGVYPNNNVGKLMHYAVSNGVKRVSPDASCYRGAIYVCAPQGNSYGSCLYTTEMTQLSYSPVVNDECPTTFPSSSTNIGTVVNFDLVKATSNMAGDPQYQDLQCTGQGTSVTNTQFYALKTNTSGTLSLTVSGYTTTPGGLNPCNPKGIELALYKVSSCPQGQNFPSPVACRTFITNGALSDITGLLANTEYLLVADGISNTKATFNLTLNGSALPIKLTSFRGEVFANRNQLFWTAEITPGTEKIIIEKSIDGTRFENIAVLSDDEILKPSNSFNDFRPSTGNNYYRLQLVSNTGEKEYSNTILLRRNDKFLFSINPNPVKDVANIQISTEATGEYGIEVYNMLGKQVARKNVLVNTTNSSIPFSLSNVSAGVYQIIVIDKSGNKLANQSIVVQH